MRAISGHVVWGIHEWLPRSFIYITILRDPIDRILSTYSYVLSSATHRLHDEMVNGAMGLEEFLEWDKGAIEVSNLQSKLLSDMYPYREKHMPTVCAKAKYNLKHYCLVGLTEQFDKSLKMFSSLFRWKNVKIERDNVTPNRIRREDVSPRTIRKIEEQNQYDLELYAFGQQLFAEQSQDIHASFARKATR